jgi:hypothetical protein
MIHPLYLWVITDHAGDPVLWEDTQDSLPGADPEVIVPQTAVLPQQEVGSTGVLEDGGGSGLSPFVSSAGPTERSLSADLEEAGAGENMLMAQGGEYIRISLTGGPDSMQEVESWRQEVTDSSSTATGGANSSIPTQSFTGPNNQMQLVPREHVPHEVHPIGSLDKPLEVQEETTVMREQLELARVKSLCASILKALAPPLMHELERTTGLSADAEPFTPKRVTMHSAAALVSTQVKMASTAESSLLKALGFCPENLLASEDNLRRFKEFFDSLIRDEHLRVLAAIFGKELPTSFEREVHCVRAVSAH